MVESEKSESGVSESTPAKATKAKASSAQKQQQSAQTKGNGDLDRLEKAYRSCQGELARMQKHLQQMQEIKTSWEASAFSLPLNLLLNKVEEVEVMVTLAHKIRIKIHLLKIQANTITKIKITTQEVEAIEVEVEVEVEEEVMGQEEGCHKLLQVSLRVGIDFVSGAETLLLLLMQTIQLKTVLIIGKLEKIGGNINSKHLLPNLLLMLLKAKTLRKTSKESI